MISTESMPQEVVVMNKDFKLEKAKVRKRHSRPASKILKVRTRTGREITATPEHPVFTIDGWKQINELKEGDSIAVPREYNLNLKREINKNKVKILAYLIGEGHIASHSITFTNTNLDMVTDLKNAVEEFDKKLTLKALTNEASYIISNKNISRKGKVLKNSIKDYLREVGLFGKLSGDKFIPNEILRLSNKQIALFLGILYSCDGSIEKRGYISFTSKSKFLIKQMQHLLLRFGILSIAKESKKRATNTKKKIKRGYYHLNIYGKEIIKFHRNIKLIHKEKQEKLNELAKEQKQKKSNPNIDIVPEGEYFRELLRKRRENLGRDKQGRFKKGREYKKEKKGKLYRKIPGLMGNHKRHSRKTTLKIAKEFNDDFLRKLANSDILWDKIKGIKKVDVDKVKVYDLEVDHPIHNFVVNDVIVHNSRDR